MSLILLGSLLVGLQQEIAGAVVPPPPLPEGFLEQVVFADLDEPTNMEFAPNGMIFVTEKAGKIKVFDDLADPDPTVFADLSANVFDLVDRGLLGLAIHPDFPAQPWIYVLYTLDAKPGQSPPYWHDIGCADTYSDGNCLAMGRLSRLTADATGKVMTGSEQVFAEGWCQQFVSHSVGDLKFGADGMLYVSGGDGANFLQVDHGQMGSPANPCGDPNMEGGGVRSQSVRSSAGNVLLNGTVLRLNPATGAPAPGNPFLASPDLNKRKVVGYGLRNPFRMVMRPGTNEIWIGDTGWNSWEDIDRLVEPLAMTPQNFGWPCYEGASRTADYGQSSIALCDSLYAPGGDEATVPYFSYDHDPTGQPGQGCIDGGYSPSGLAFYPHTGGNYPAEYGGALFVADYSRQCIFVMKTAQTGGLPSPGRLSTFAGVANPVDLELGPDNDIYYVSRGGTVRRISYYSANRPPVAIIQASHVMGYPPLTVTFDGSASYDNDQADQGMLTYQWDFTNDGVIDATGKIVQHVYASEATYTAKLTVIDSSQASSSATIQINVNGFAPIPTINTPAETLKWSVGQAISFSGSATDLDDGTVPPSGLQWELRLQHCAAGGGCHTHSVRTWNGVASGSFSAPDHDLPAHLELVLTATDSSGQKSTVVRQLNPKAIDLAVQTVPSGLTVTTASYSAVAPYSVQLIQNTQRSVFAPATQTLDGKLYGFLGWSDGGAQRHDVTVTANQQPLWATYVSCAGWYKYLHLGACVNFGQIAPRQPESSGGGSPIVRY